MYADHTKLIRGEREPAAYPSEYLMQLGTLLSHFALVKWGEGSTCNPATGSSQAVCHVGVVSMVWYRQNVTTWRLAAGMIPTRIEY